MRITTKNHEIENDLSWFYMSYKNGYRIYVDILTGENLSLF